MKGSIDIPTGASQTRWAPWLRPRLFRQRADSDREKWRSEEGELGDKRGKEKKKKKNRRGRQEEEGEGGSKENKGQRE
jgi:hypothetical protein